MKEIEVKAWLNWDQYIGIQKLLMNNKAVSLITDTYLQGKRGSRIRLRMINSKMLFLTIKNSGCEEKEQYITYANLDKVNKMIIDYYNLPKRSEFNLKTVIKAADFGYKLNKDCWALYYTIIQYLKKFQISVIESCNKFRQENQILPNTTICLDHISDMGNFLEIEYLVDEDLTEEQIKFIKKELSNHLVYYGLKRSQKVDSSYLDIMLNPNDKAYYAKLSFGY